MVLLYCSAFLNADLYSVGTLVAAAAADDDCCVAADSLAAEFAVELVWVELAEVLLAEALSEDALAVVVAELEDWLDFEDDPLVPTPAIPRTTTAIITQNHHFL